MEYLHMRINELLKENKISKNRICKDLDLVRGNFNRYCRDEFQRIDARLLLKLCTYFNCDIKDYEVVNNVARSNYPILLSAGSNEQLEGLFEAIKNVNPNETEIIILPGCNHGNGMYKQTELYQGAIKNFVSKHIK